MLRVLIKMYEFSSTHTDFASREHKSTNSVRTQVPCGHKAGLKLFSCRDLVTAKVWKDQQDQRGSCLKDISPNGL